MLLQQIAASLDAELENLHKLRSIVASLQTTRKMQPVEQKEFAAAIQLIDAEAAPVQVTRLPPSRKGRGKTRGVARRQVSPLPAALAGPIPAGPVVVGAATVARETAQRHGRATIPDKPQPEPGTLGAMIRALELRAAG